MFIVHFQILLIEMSWVCNFMFELTTVVLISYFFSYRIFVKLCLFLLK